MEYFHYKSNILHAENTNIYDIAKLVKTPFYCYSQNAIKKQFLRYKNSLRDQDIVAYALKANSHQAILNILQQEGSGADIVSGGEFFRALKAKIPAEKIIYSGVGKTIDEIDYALSQNIKCFNVESNAELWTVKARAKELNKKAPISLRINPDIDPKTHKKISTGSKTTKFGIPLNEAFSLYQKIKNDKDLIIKGVDLHIGSQISSLDPFQKAFEITKKFIQELQFQNIFLKHIDVGGGLGISYHENEEMPTVEEYTATILASFKDFEGQIICEPGRNIVGNSGIFITKVLYLKKTDEKNFIIVDGAMNDLIRPTLYDAYQEIKPIKKPLSEHKEIADIVGPVCETGDYLALNRSLIIPEQNDLLAIMSAGAYGASMASTYNSRTIAAEVMVNGNGFDIIRPKKDYSSLTQDEILPFWFKN